EVEARAVAEARRQRVALRVRVDEEERRAEPVLPARHEARVDGDRKSTRLNSSHDQISYAVLCLKKQIQTHHERQKQPYGRQHTSPHYRTHPLSLHDALPILKSKPAPSPKRGVSVLLCECV